MNQVQTSMSSGKNNANTLVIKKPKNIANKSRNLDENSDRVIIENKVETNEIKNFVFKRTKRLNKSFNARSELETISPQNNIIDLY